MTTPSWERVKSVVAQALELHGTARSAYVAGACADDAALRDEVDSLLAAAGDGDSLPGARDAVAAEAARLATSDDDTLRVILERALGEQYEIVRPLGRGGMGAVFLARERALEREVAVKVLPPPLAASAEGRERFRREARVVAGLRHPGILPLHAFGEMGDVSWLVMGYVRGESLAERLRRGRLDPEEATRILRELAEAVDWAHRHGVVHRDITPSNVLLDEESGRAVLADFGVSKVRGVADPSGAVVGTPAYMSPEQAAGAQDVDERSDVWALGAVGYAMLAGRAPIAAVGTPGAAPASLRTLAPHVPTPLATVLMRCLARDRERRWPSARALAEALARAAEGVPALPEGLRDLPGFGPYALLWTLGWSMLALFLAHDLGDRLLLVLVALLVPVGLVLHVWLAGRHGLGVLELVRVACWPPEWWGMWWPRRLRRPGDVWGRLPLPARVVRVALSLFFVGLPTALLERRALGAALAPVEAALVLLAGVTTGGAMLWAGRRGLAPTDAVRLLLGPTAGEGWRAPTLARLLAPSTGRGARGAGSPPALRGAMMEHATSPSDEG